MTEVTDDDMRRMLATSKPYTVVLLKGTAKLQEPEAMKVVWEHGRRNMELWIDGLMPVVLRCTDDSDWSGFAVFAGTPDEVAAIMDADPGVQAEIFTYELHPVSSFPGSTLPG